MQYGTRRLIPTRHDLLVRAVGLAVALVVGAYVSVSTGYASASTSPTDLLAGVPSVSSAGGGFASP